MHRFFIEGQLIQVRSAVDLNGIRHQLAHVLRMKPGDSIVLLDNHGYEYVTEIVSLDSGDALGVVRDKYIALGEPTTDLTLYQCVLKGERMEWVLQKGTELGVSRFVPVISERTIVRPTSAVSRKYDRWNTIIREAAEQCGRGRLPVLDEPLPWGDAIADSVDDAAALRMVPWEEAEGQPSITRVVESHGNSEGSLSASLLIGPEGGISLAEIEAAGLHNWYTVTMGRRVLRAETAAVAAVTMVMAATGEMG